MNLFGQLVGLLGWGISPTQGLYLHRTTQHRKKAGIHPCPLGIYYCCDKINEVELGGTCSIRGWHEKYMQNFLSENLKGWVCFGDQGLDGKIILKWILKKQGIFVIPSHRSKYSLQHLVLIYPSISCSSLRGRDQVSYPSDTARNIVV
jgi:hypothetical protein